ncbi:proto-oncogene Mas-like [Ambystoma mexicanum]|uniref:proto-oncogene Mas-like n=1 Tax=Ambystoma mexicanum TaxID=8296 RepID=UPI0037E7CF0E
MGKTWNAGFINMTISMEETSSENVSDTVEGWSPEDWFDRPGEEDHTLLLILRSLSLVFSVIGLVGNGIVLWFLFFRIHSNPFTVYILNLALADFTVLLSSFITLLYVFVHPPGEVTSTVARNVLLTLRIFNIFGFNTSLYLLTAISLERCLSVYHPIWYKCRRPQHQSVIVCMLLWALSCLMTGSEFFLCDEKMYAFEDYQCAAALITSFGFGFIILAPIMVISSLTLLCKICSSSRQHQSPKLFIVISITVVVFLKVTIPPRLLDILLYFKVISPGIISFFSANHAGMICSTINGCVDPFIYVFVGGLWKHRGKNPIHRALHTVFKNETSIIAHEEPSQIRTLS